MKPLHLIGVLLVSACCFSVQAGNNNGNGSTPNGQPFKHLQEQIDQLNADLDELAQSTGESIASLEADVMSLQSAVADLQSQIDANDAELAQLQTDTDANADAIAALEATATSLQEQLDQLGAELASKQDILDGACAPGYSLRVIYPDGGFLCEFDNSDSPQRFVVRAGPYVPVSGSILVMRRAYSGACPAGFFPVSGHSFMRRKGNTFNVNISESSRYSKGWQVFFSRAYGNRYVGQYVRAVMTCMKTLN
ncbi:hypothetical protein AAEU32_02960 [Pseudoalteromonas sp. SSDWG2]|uniref:hypothetical protein n=1 Tax=Pseudoalteromonas sp. SSDWG2 TaxID=3139391 RepID=UPI003BABFE15